MSDELYTAALNPSSPRYIEWRRIFPDDRIELLGVTPIKATLGEESEFVYLLDLQAMEGDVYDRLVHYIARKFNVDDAEVVAEFEDKNHFPIRTSDVIVIFSQRAFI